MHRDLASHDGLPGRGGRRWRQPRGQRGPPGGGRAKIENSFRCHPRKSSLKRSGVACLGLPPLEKIYRSEYALRPRSIGDQAWRGRTRSRLRLRRQHECRTRTSAGWEGSGLRPGAARNRAANRPQSQTALRKRDIIGGVHEGPPIGGATWQATSDDENSLPPAQSRARPLAAARIEVGSKKLGPYHSKGVVVS